MGRKTRKRHEAAIRELEATRAVYGDQAPETYAVREKYAGIFSAEFGKDWSARPPKGSQAEAAVAAYKQEQAAKQAAADGPTGRGYDVDPTTGRALAPTDQQQEDFGSGYGERYGNSVAYQNYIQDRTRADSEASRSRALTAQDGQYTRAVTDARNAAQAEQDYQSALSRQLQSREQTASSIGNIRTAADQGIATRNQALADNDMRTAVAGNNAIRNQALAGTDLRADASRANNIAEEHLNRVDLRGAAGESAATRNAALAKTDLRRDASNANGIADAALAKIDLRNDAQAANGERTAALNKIDLEARGGDANKTRQNAYDQTHFKDDAFDAASGLTVGSNDAIGMRDAALAKGNLNDAAGLAIEKNDALAQERLAQQSDLISRSARGLAGSMGEGGALAMQGAIAGAGLTIGDLAAQDQNTRAQQASDMRYGAARDQIANELSTADKNATQRYLGASDAAAMKYRGSSDQYNALLTNAEQQAQQQYGAASEQAANNIYVGDRNAAQAYQGSADQAQNNITVGMSNADRSYAGSRDQVGNELMTADKNADTSYLAAADTARNNITVGNASADRSYAGSRDQTQNVLSTADRNASDYLQGYDMQATNALGVADKNADQGYNAALSTNDAYSRLFGQDMQASTAASSRGIAYNDMADQQTNNWAGSVQNMYGTDLQNESGTLASIVNARLGLSAQQNQKEIANQANDTARRGQNIDLAGNVINSASNLAKQKGVGF